MKLALIRCLPLAALLLILAPGAAAASARYAEVAVATPGTPGLRVLPPRAAPIAFDLLGARWSARPGVTVGVRARALGGAWSPWTTLDDGDGGPVSHADPLWVPGSAQFQLRVRGAPRRLRIAFVAADRSPLRQVLAPAAAPDQPPIVSRAGWGAVESLKRGAPRYADAVHTVFVHHTDTPNGYAPEDVPAIIRSIYVYHVRSNGWNDIGYNFLVDAYGRIFEGRAGGIDKPVIGAHTGGFNTGSVGIAVIGNGSLAPLTAQTRDALARLIAWRLDVAHVDPLGKATLTSAGNDRYAAGKTATFRVVSGHRDALSTDCPGALVYPELDGIAAAAQAIGTPKIVDASATPPGLGTDAGGVLQPIAFRARVIGGASWVLTVIDARGLPVASGSGSGGDVAWTWNGARSDGTPVAAGTKLAYRIEAKDASGAAARTLLGSLGALPTVVEAPPLSLAPTVISPDADGSDDVLAIGYTLAAPAAVTLDVVAPDGTIVSTLVADVPLPAGSQSARWSGEGLAGIVADGAYTVRLHLVEAAGQIAERSAPVTVIRAVRKLKLNRAAVGAGEGITAAWQQSALASVSGELSSPRSASPVPLLAAVLEPGGQRLKLTAAELAAMPDGTYTFALRAQMAVGQQVLRATFRLDRTPPAARFVRVRVRKRGVFLVVRLSEATTVRVLAGARVVVPRRLRGAGVNGFRFRLPEGAPAKLRLQMVDASGNAARAGPYRPAPRR